MSVQDMVAEIPTLPFGERLRLLNVISVSLQRDLISERNPRSSFRGASVDTVLGMLKPANGVIPNDEEVKQIIYESIMEKHA